MILEKDLRRVRNASRSQGAYLGVSAAKVPDAREADFLWVMAEDLALDNTLFVGVDATGAIRRFFAFESPSPADFGSMVADRSMLDALFTSFGGSEVVDLLPIPLRRVLNFRFVAFMLDDVSRDPPALVVVFAAQEKDA